VQSEGWRRASPVAERQPQLVALHGDNSYEPWRRCLVRRTGGPRSQWSSGGSTRCWSAMGSSGFRLPTPFILVCVATDSAARSANRHMVCGGLATDRRAPHVSVFWFKINLKSDSNAGKIGRQQGKNLKIFVGVEKSNLEHFHYCNFFQTTMHFEIFKRFWVKTGLTDLWSYKLIATLFLNRPELHFGQGVVHGDIQSLCYHLVDMHKLTPKIQEIMEFQKWLIIKLILEKFKSGIWVV
jgi:hypothetical protein